MNAEEQQNLETATELETSPPLAPTENDAASEVAVTWPVGVRMEADGLYVPDSKGIPSRASGPFEILGLARTSRSDGWGPYLVWLDRDGVRHEAMVSFADLVTEGTEALRALANGDLEICHARGLRQALNGVKCHRRVRIVERLGWHGTAFVMPDRTIGPTEEVIAWTGNRNARFAERGTLDEWRNAVAALAAGNSRLVFSISVALSGPLAGLLNEPNAGFHLRGASSTGKSSALYAAGSVWGGGQEKGFVQSWRTTDNALEGTAAAHSDTCLLLDELNELPARAAVEAVYALGNGQGKARSQRDGHLRARLQWRLTFLSSGEIALAEKVAEYDGRKTRIGADIRLIDLSADAGKGFGLFDDLHGRADGSVFSQELKKACVETYGTAGPAFVAYLAENLDSVKEEASMLIDELVAKWAGPNAEGQVLRVCQMFAVVATAGEFARVALGLPLADGEPIEAARVMFEEWRAGRGGEASAELVQALDAIRATVGRDVSRFERMDGDVSYRVYERLGFRGTIRGQDCWGFLPDAWKETLRGIADPHWVARELAKRDIVLLDAQGKSTCTVKRDAHQYRVFAVRVDRLMEEI